MVTARDFWLGLATLCVLLATCVRAEDRVTYHPSGSSRPITMVGDIFEYTGEVLRMKALGGTTQVIPAEDIVAVKTHYDVAHREGLDAYEAGRIEEALSKFLTAYDREPREWVDREIASWLVRCSLRNDDQLSALRFFRELVKSDPTTRHWGIAPLVWSPVSLTNELRETARPLLASQHAAERLLAASILLFDTDFGRRAERELNDLASDPNPRLSRLARAQLWRIALARNEVTENILQNWRDQINGLPVPLRPGPQYLLGRGYAHLGEQRLAAAEFLKLTIVYANHDALTARATLEAAEAIERTGLTQEANVLYRELLQRFPNSTESTVAREKLSAVTSGS